MKGLKRHPGEERKLKRIRSWLWQPTGDLPSFTEGYDERYVAALMSGLGRHVTLPWRLELYCDRHWFDRLNEWLKGHPQWLATDMLLPILMQEPFNGWAHMMEIFKPEHHRPARGERILAVGIDTIIVGDCDWLFEWDEADCGWIADPYAKGTISNSVMTFNNLGAACLWDRYLEAKRQNFPQWCRMFDQPSEMMIMREHFSKYIHPLLEEEPHRLLSYKAHTRDGLWWPGTPVSIVYFHGSPKPHELPFGHPLLSHWQNIS